MNRERERKGEGEKGACRNDQGFRFPNAGNLCHVQINYSGRKHNNNGYFLIHYTSTKLVNTICRKIRKSVNPSIILLSKPRIPQIRYMEIDFLCRSYKPRFLLLIYIKITSGVLFTGCLPFVTLVSCRSSFNLIPSHILHHVMYCLFTHVI